MPISKAELKEQKRETIVAAATDEFLNDGFHGTSMDRIADAAKVSKRTVYNHFTSKEELFQAILAKLVLRVEQMKHHDYSADAPLEPQLTAIGETYAETITGQHIIKYVRVVVSRCIQRPDMSQATLEEHEKLRVNLIQWLGECRRDGRLSISDAENAAAQFCGMITEVIYWPQLMGSADPVSKREREAAVASAVKLFLGYYQA